VSELVRKAEAADSAPLDDGLTIPDEVARRKDRIASLRQAREIIERRFAAERAEAQAAYEAKLAEREAKRREGRRPRGPDPKPPADTPPGDRQHNFTDCARRRSNPPSASSSTPWASASFIFGAIPKCPLNGASYASATISGGSSSWTSAGACPQTSNYVPKTPEKPAGGVPALTIGSQLPANGPRSLRKPVLAKANENQK